ncbi:hypothetical protein [Marinobacter daepoensis]|uniref:hypothetical protein n=1 Tax=Marinobacter daepoensis TaxID=262077 RepID=UPI000420E175|nr:hypothetical protein [Marinobacter daepoensis]MBY6033216.1 hypothetical protein [Marinobacter daepoensis]
MFTLRRKGNYQLQLTRSLTGAGRYDVELYLFTPHEGSLSSRALSEKRFYFSSLEHRLRLLGLPDQDRAAKADQSFTLLSPHYEIRQGSSLFQYRASLDRLRQQIETSGLSDELLKRALRLSEKFAQRLRKSAPEQSSQQRYYRLLDTCFSWNAEQFFLECMTLENYDALAPGLQASALEFLQQEALHRKTQDYTSNFKGTPTRIWNRMRLYHRILEYPLLLRTRVTELGEGTRKLVKAATTTLVMLLFTYLLFNIRDVGQTTLSLTLLLGIALIYAIRDLLRDDMINAVTLWLRRGKPRWKVRLSTPYTSRSAGQKKVWLDYRKARELPAKVREQAQRWTSNDEQQVICYRSALSLEKATFERDHLQDRISLDCEALCELVQPTTVKLYAWKDPEHTADGVKAHPIEKQHDYQLLLLCTEPGKEKNSAQRWQLRLSHAGIVQCKSKNTS